MGVWFKYDNFDNDMAKKGSPARNDSAPKKNWIKGAIKHPGALHRELGVPAGQKIPAKKLTAAAHSSNPTERRRANFAKELKGFRKG